MSRMSDIRITREEFMTAYKFYYGDSHKRALKAWREYTDKGKRILIAGYREQTKLEFYFD